MSGSQLLQQVSFNTSLIGSCEEELRKFAGGFLTFNRLHVIFIRTILRGFFHRKINLTTFKGRLTHIGIFSSLSDELVTETV